MLYYRIYRIVEEIVLEIVNELKRGRHLDDKLLAKIIHKHDKRLDDKTQHYSKKRLLPYYLKVKESDSERWDSWDVDAAIEQQLLQILQMKPRRTASGVATITVITKPWKCSSDCLYCPNDLRMPKSYLSDEPACQRAERNYFDPYLQVVSRVRALTQMGHVTDKIELIVLGGTWSDYPSGYQTWFVTELFRALNDGIDSEEHAKAKRDFYKRAGVSNREEELQVFAQEKQREVNSGSLTYNQAVEQLYGSSQAWQSVAAEQVSGLDELARQHRINETAQHRVVGLVIETRPDAITSESLTLLRCLGCTKIQMGIQSLDPTILRLNNRGISLERIQQAFELLRLFGFKIHTHVMLNLYGSSPEKDKQDYKRLVSEKPYLPDEVKLYPCSLVGGTKLCAHNDDGTWQPYGEEELLDTLITDTLNTPPFIRISRMIRDISAHSILTGNKKTNLRQLVERGIETAGKSDCIEEIRYREISTNETDIARLALVNLSYETTVADEYFLQWVTSQNRIAGFLRLSLPREEYVREHQDELPVQPYEAMIREVHVYGKVAGLHATGENAQHLGLGKQLIKAACAIAKDRGYQAVNVISSVGTREYYRGLGFADNGLYQQKRLP